MPQKATAFRFDSASTPTTASIPRGKGARNRPKRPSNAYVPGKKKTVLKRKIKAKRAIVGDKLVFHMPMITLSEANNFEHWTKKNDRHKLQKQMVFEAMHSAVRDDVWRFVIPCHVKMTRLAPRKLDRRDNLPMAFKYVLDAVCAVITGDYRPGRADDNEEIIVAYEQRSSPEYGVIIEITNLNSLNSQDGIE